MEELYNTILFWFAARHPFVVRRWGYFSSITTEPVNFIRQRFYIPVKYESPGIGYKEALLFL